jgi:hypothetical protein
VITTTVLNYSFASTDNAPVSSHRFLANLGTFMKQSATTKIQVVWNSSVNAPNGECNFQIRVDSAAMPGGDFGAVLNPGTGGNLNFQVPVSTTSIFSALAAGSHTVSLWDRGLGAPSCTDNVGNYTHTVIVTEY